MGVSYNCTPSRRALGGAVRTVTSRAVSWIDWRSRWSSGSAAAPTHTHTHTRMPDERDSEHRKFAHHTCMRTYRRTRSRWTGWSPETNLREKAVTKRRPGLYRPPIQTSFVAPSLGEHTDTIHTTNMRSTSRKRARHASSGRRRRMVLACPNRRWDIRALPAELSEGAR